MWLYYGLINLAINCYQKTILFISLEMHTDNIDFVAMTPIDGYTVINIGEIQTKIFPCAFLCV